MALTVKPDATFTEGCLDAVILSTCLVELIVPKQEGWPFSLAPYCMQDPHVIKAPSKAHPAQKLVL